MGETFSAGRLNCNFHLYIYMYKNSEELLFLQLNKCSDWRDELKIPDLVSRLVISI